MSVVLQPYQALPFNTSLDFQTSRQKGGSLCTFDNPIDEGTFIPFAILSPDEVVGEINLFNCADELLQELTLTIVSTQDEDTGLWFHYYNGDNLGLSCGTYYITIVVGGFIWYSEQFTIRDIVNASQYPELIKDDYHLPLRIYDSITKQLINKSDIGCQVQPLNPVSTIMPFMFYTDEDICNLNVFLVDACTEEETDLSADLELEFIKENEGEVITQDVVTTSQLLRNFVYYFDSRSYVFQEFTTNDYGLLKDITFEYRFENETQDLTISLIKGLNINTTPIAIEMITDTAPLNKELTIDFSSYNIQIAPGEKYLLVISTDAQCEGKVILNSTKVYPDGRFALKNEVPQISNIVEYVVYEGRNVDVDTLKAYPTLENSTVQCLYQSSEPTSGAYSISYNTQYDHTVSVDTTQALRLYMTGFNLTVTDGANVRIRVNYNGVDIYSTVQNFPVGGTFNISDVDFSFNVIFPNGSNSSYEVKIYYQIDDVAAVSQSFNSGNIKIYTYLYGEIVDGVYSPTNYLPVGVNYLNHSLWFYVNVTKSVNECGYGSTKVYNPARPLPSPLICGNYYLKLVSNLHTWYSEWFRVINVGTVDLTTYVLGTEDGEIISTEDGELIEI